MKTAPKVIFAFDGGVATAILDGLQANPSSSSRKSEESFDLSLDRYGIKDSRASGNITHFIDDDRVPQVSIFVLQKYPSPVLACAISEVLLSLARQDTSSLPSLILPFILDSSKIKLGREKSENENIFGIQLGTQTDLTQALVSGIPKAPSSMQIHDESLSCVLQLVRVLNTPSFILIGQSGQHKASQDDLEVICEMGEALASALSLQFVKAKVSWRPAKASKENEKEPWRALYG